MLRSSWQLKNNSTDDTSNIMLDAYSFFSKHFPGKFKSFMHYVFLPSFFFKAYTVLVRSVLIYFGNATNWLKYCLTCEGSTNMVLAMLEQ